MQVGCHLRCRQAAIVFQCETVDDHIFGVAKQIQHQLNGGAANIFLLKHGGGAGFVRNQIAQGNGIVLVVFC